MAQVRWKARGQGAAYGLGGGPAFQPGGDGRGETVYIPLREQQPGLVTPELHEEGGGRAVVFEGLGVSGFGGRRRYGPRRGRRRYVFGGALRDRGLWYRSRVHPGLVVRHGARDNLAAGEPYPGALQVAVRLKFPQGRGDPYLALGEAGGEGLMSTRAPAGSDWMCTASPIAVRRAPVLGEVVADDRVVGWCAG